MRTYGLVCMASTALTVFVGHAVFVVRRHRWPVSGRPDAGGAGRGHRHRLPVCRRDHEGRAEHQRPHDRRIDLGRIGRSACCWGSASMPPRCCWRCCAWLSMSMLHRLEAKLPGRSTLEVRVTFSAAGPPSFDDLAERAEARGYRVLGDSLRITFSEQPAGVALLRGGAGPRPRSVAGIRSRTKWPCLTAWRASASCR